MPNRLVNQKSPYLLQHAHNPVDWYPWSEEAFTKANQENKPIFLSIGYSTCHWCHVMERESFEDPEVAQILNQNFVSIKVDREERPDIDQVYMTVCQALTGHGGWPLTIIMTPDKKPFFSGTYFPKQNRMGMSGLTEILTKVSQAWENNRNNLLEAGKKITQTIQSSIQTYSNASISESTLNEAYLNFRSLFDHNFGGFSDAPKFPTPHNLFFLLRYWKVNESEDALRMVEKTLDSMYHGGIFDHIGYGFSRYSTDRKWLVPHFEKMLYDNALLAIAYLEAYQATQKSKYADIAEKIFTYILRDMTSPDGGFYSAEDADSEGEEGKFYLWTPKEVKSVLGDSEGEFFCKHFNITENGNFEGRNIPNVISVNTEILTSEDQYRLNLCRQKLFEYRKKRVHPYKDDKLLTSWNGLMIAALSYGSRVLGVREYSLAAQKAVSFIENNLRDTNGRLLARYRDGESAYPAYVDDYSFLIWGLIELYEATFKPDYLKLALDLNDQLIKYFWDNENGGLFIYGHDNEQLISRPKEIYDGATPSGNSVSTLNFLRLARLTGKHELEDLAQQQFKFFGGTVKDYPTGYSYFLMALLFLTSKTKEIVIAGDPALIDTKIMLQTINDVFLPHSVFHIHSQGDTGQELVKMVPFLEEQKSVNNLVKAYICENFSCQSPITDTVKFIDTLQEYIH